VATAVWLTVQFIGNEWIGDIDVITLEPA
jgi:hypothetical protein